MKPPPPRIETAFVMDSARFYNQHTGQLAAQYEALNPATIHAPWRNFLPAPPASVLDVGCGSGRDAAWLGAMGHAVTAVDPSEEMIRWALRHHPSSRISWRVDALPLLQAVTPPPAGFDLILAGAVWMHLAPKAQIQSLSTLSRLMTPAGRLVITLRSGPSPDARIMHPVDPDRLAAAAGPAGLAPTLLTRPDADQLGRRAVHWRTLVLTKKR